MKKLECECNTRNKKEVSAIVNNHTVFFKTCKKHLLKLESIFDIHDYDNSKNEVITN